MNLEPCSHQGRTPPCADALIAAGVAKVVAPMEDPNPQVAGAGLRAGCATRASRWRWPREFAAEAEKLNEAFVHFMRTGRPLVTLKAALTLDGKIAAPDDNRGWITSERARAHVQELRHDHDAILTGIGTVLADDCLLTDRTGMPRSRPLLRIVLDSQLRLPLDSKMVRSARRRRAGGDHFGGAPPSGARCWKRAASRCWCSTARAGAPICAASSSGWAAAVPVADDRGGQQAELDGARSGLVDKIFFYYGPKILGGLESLPVAGGIGRRRRADAIRVHDITHAPDSAGRIRRGRIPGCSPGSLKSWERWKRCRRAAGARLTVRCAHGAGGSDRGREHRGERRVPDGGRICVPDSFRRRPGAGDPAAQQPRRPARGVAGEPGAAAFADRAAERPHRAGPRGRHRRVPVARRAGRRQLVAAHSRAGGTGSVTWCSRDRSRSTASA